MEYDLMLKAKEMSDAGSTHAEIMRVIGRDEQWIVRSINILTYCPADMLKWLKDGRMSRSAAEKMLKYPKEKIAAIWKRAVELYKLLPEA